MITNERCLNLDLLIFFIYNAPDRTDDELDVMGREYCEPGKYGETEVMIAVEGRLLTV
ncbi:hypothetical protein [Desulfosediminicola ganghwensis]|uniref:hypothetical protein n=1 Tax=Desulfosediminicola ganghwensis TaxID=2569540 RepID=UPI0012948312|nr:hypothetical protein [Desulfosediminicola ganghwensis]